MWDSGESGEGGEASLPFSMEVIFIIILLIVEVWMLVWWEKTGDDRRDSVYLWISIG